MIQKAQLVHFSNAERFTETYADVCPRCAGPILIDNWPPNAWAMSATAGVSTLSGQWKCVCLHCEIAFRLSFRIVSESGQEDERHTIASDIEALVEQGGKYLTPHDVWREAYKAEHGGYPLEIYG